MSDFIFPLPPKWEPTLDCGWITFKSGMETIRGYYAKPAKVTSKLPAIVMAAERLGIIEHRQDVTRRFAKLGYACLTVDPYSRCGGQPPQTYKTQEERRIQCQLATIDEIAVPDMQAACDWLAKNPDIDATRIGAIGFCAGGGTLYGWLCGQSTNVKTAVVYYGSVIARAEGRPDGVQVNRRDVASKMQCRVQIHHGASDKVIPLESVHDMVSELQKAGHGVDLHVYADADHAYHDDTYPNYHEAAAKLSWDRTVEFFKNNL